MNIADADYKQTAQQLANVSVERLEAVKGLIAGWQRVETDSTPPVSTEIAQKFVNAWLLNAMPDRFVALEPCLIAGGDIWSVPVGLSYPNVGIVGTVGEVLVSAFARGIISAPQPAVMKLKGAEIYREKENVIQAAFSSAGDS